MVHLFYSTSGVDCSLLKSILLGRFKLHSIPEKMTKAVLSVIESVGLCICQWQQPLAELTQSLGSTRQATECELHCLCISLGVPYVPSIWGCKYGSLITSLAFR